MKDRAVFSCRQDDGEDRGAVGTAENVDVEQCDDIARETWRCRDRCNAVVFDARSVREESDFESRTNG